MKPLALAVGDPAGVGPEVAVRAAAAPNDDATVLYGDGADLSRRLEVLGVTPAFVGPSVGSRVAPLGAGQVGVIDVGGVPDPVRQAHAPSAAGGRAQLAALDAAIADALAGRCRAIVTGPTSKEAVTLAGAAFTGQTEHLARAAGLAADDVTMLFLGPKLKVSLVTTHLSIRAVPEAITGARVERATLHLAEAVSRLSDGATIPTLVVSGLNPHAGEGGLFGDEEERVVAPTVAALRRGEPFAGGGFVLEGPTPAEAAFRAAAAGRVDGVVAMFHDQATIASKLLDWGQAVNVTWGLPFLRTSVDHGVAYDAAAAGAASADGMVAALGLARRLIPGSP